MHRWILLSTAGGIPWWAGCSTTPSSRTDQRDNPTPSADDTSPAGTWPQTGYDAQNTRSTSQARGPGDTQEQSLAETE